MYHSGDLGDIIYSLLWCRVELGSIRMILGPDARWKLRHQMDVWTYRFLYPLLFSQSWIQEVNFSPVIVSCDFCLNDFRLTWFNRRQSSNLFQAYAEQFKTLALPENFAWLEVEPKPLPDLPVVIARSGRYRNGMFPWYTISKAYRDRMAFVGLKEEHEDWSKHYGKGAVFVPVKDALEMAQIIAGARLFIGNQSFPMSLALAMNKSLIQEVGHPNADCRFNRPNAVYWEGGPLPLPTLA